MVAQVNAAGIPMSLSEYWDLDVQTQRDIGTILRYERDVAGAMTTKEAA